MYLTRYFLWLAVLGIALSACQPTKPGSKNSTGPSVTAPKKPTITTTQFEVNAEKSAADKADADLSDNASAASLDPMAPTQNTGTQNAGTQNAGTQNTDIAGTPEIVEPQIPIKPPAGPAQLYPVMKLGMSLQELTTVLGEADFQRVEGPVKIWQYQTEICVLDFYLYPQDGDYIITHWDWRSPIVGAEFDIYACRVELALKKVTR
jgi:hypothetical protein